jgi:hypothetical protein
MKSSFKTVALIGKYKSPEVAAPLMKLARYLERMLAAKSHPAA